MRHARMFAMALLLTCAAATSLNAQSAAAPRVRVGAGIGLDLVVGEQSDFLDGGSSRFLMAAFRFTENDFLHVRLDAAFTALEDDEDEFSGARAQNDMYSLLVGPQISLPLGRLRPFAATLAGVASIHRDLYVPPEFVNLSEQGTSSAFAWGVHTGLSFTVDQGDHPVAFQMEARLLDPGMLDFARRPELGRHESTAPLRDDVAVLSLRLSVTLGF